MRLNYGAALVAMIALCSSNAKSESWSNWELKNSIGQKKAFLVIKQPGEGFCYVKQSYENDPDKMSLTYSGGAPSIITPFLYGIEGDVQYWVDNNPKYTIFSKEIDGTRSFNLSKDIMGELRAGNYLNIRIKPKRDSIRTQRFSLQGFTAATYMLSSKKCGGDDNVAVTSNLEVKLTRDANGKIYISGNTTLPNEMNLMISLRSERGEYFGQDKVVVRSGKYKTSGFSNKGSALPGGNYKVSISSPLMSLQPASVKQRLGESGREIPKEIRKKSSFGDSYRVKYLVARSVK
jgi:hypothetical protein